MDAILDPRKDLASAGPFVPRPGDEGAVGDPALVYQLWRSLPGSSHGRLQRRLHERRTPTM